MKHIMLRAIFHYLNVGFVCSVDKRQPLSVAQERSLDWEGEEQKILNVSFILKIFCFINQKWSMGVGLLHNLKSLNLNVSGGGAFNTWRFLELITKIINF